MFDSPNAMGFERPWLTLSAGRPIEENASS